MYGFLLESVQHFVVQECGEEVWFSILREAGGKIPAEFTSHQQYPDTLMFRLASALARRMSKDPNSPTSSTPGSPTIKKSSFKKRSSWKSSSINNDVKTQNIKCPFSATKALAEATKEQLAAFNSTEELRNKLTQEIPSRTRTFKSSVADLQDTGCQLAEIDNTKFAAKAKESPSSPTSVKFDDNVITEAKTTNVKCTSVGSTPVKKFSPPPSLPLSCFSNSRKSSTKSEDCSVSPRAISPIQRPRLNSISCLDKERRSSGFIGLPLVNTKVNYLGNKDAATMKEKLGTPEKVMHFFGRCFVKFFSIYGYDNMIRATGRYFCIFLQSVDNIHQRMRFTFQRMRSPTMQLTRAHRHGAELVYSSTRHGFTHYLMGQLYEIAEDIFSLKLKASVVKESIEGAYYVAVLRLEFDNGDYVQSLMARKAEKCPMPAVDAALLIKLFPFGVLLDRRMKIIMAGDKLVQAWGGPFHSIEKMYAHDILRLRKPKINFTWDKVVSMQSVLFELELIRWGVALDYGAAEAASDARRPSQGVRVILLKGPMRLLDQIDAIIFLCSPIFNDLDELRQAGLYLEDMNGHGLSRELLLTGWQHLSRLELLFEKAENRSLSLEKSCRLLDQWKKRSDQLLYSMIPKTIVDLLRGGKDPRAACQAFDSVTVMFCAVHTTETESRAGVMQTVANINDLYSKIDRLLDAHRVYKVETVGSVYMVVSGAPERTRAHAPAVAGAALDISRALPALTIGIHSGPCVGGVLGLRLPRYCLVGDTVNTASRMQTTSVPGKIQISSATAALLPPRFRLRRRGLTKVKGKGMMETFWLEGEVEDNDNDEALQLFSALCGED